MLRLLKVLREFLAHTKLTLPELRDMLDRLTSVGAPPSPLDMAWLVSLCGALAQVKPSLVFGWKVAQTAQFCELVQRLLAEDPPSLDTPELLGKARECGEDAARVVVLAAVCAEVARLWK